VINAYAKLFEEARAAEKVAIQIFSAAAMQDPHITIRQKAKDIESYGFTSWYTGMQSLILEDLWEYHKHHKYAYLYLVLTGDCSGKTYSDMLLKATWYEGIDGEKKAIPPGIDQRIDGGARSPKAFLIDKFDHFPPRNISEDWFAEFPYGRKSGALFVAQSLPDAWTLAKGKPSTSNRHWIGIGRLCGDFGVRLHA
jgi:hypothetical protein